MRQTLVDEAQHLELLEQGFVTTRSFATGEELAAVRAALEGLGPADGFDPPGGTPTNPRSYHCTFLDIDNDYRTGFDQLVRDTFADRLRALLPEYEILASNCYAKQPGRGDFEAHLNWHVTTDVNDITLTVWVPLHDTAAANGGLMVVPRSHRITDWIAHPRGAHYFSEYQDVVIDEYYRSVPVTAGDAVVFDDSLIHGSGENRSDAPRFALQIEMIPTGSVPAVFYPTTPDRFDVLAAPRSFYLGTVLSEIMEWPEMFEVLDRVPNPNTTIDRPELDRRLANATEVRRELWGW